MHSLTSSAVPAVQQQTEAFSRKAMSLDAFPSAIDAFPASAGAFPVSLSAYAACVPQSGVAQCHSQWRSDITANPNPQASPSQILGYQPADLQNAYGVTTAAANGGSGQTIAIVVAYHDPNLNTTLSTYRAAFGLPTCSFPTATLGISAIFAPGAWKNSCLRVLWPNGNANGQGYWTSVPPAFNQSWAIEEDLDVEMASAICPNCKILVSESPDATVPNLVNAVTNAVNQGATEVSNSYTLPDAASLSQYDWHYQQNGVPMTASAGDAGYGPGYPASVPSVTAVGGASLVNNGGTWGEAIWPGTGSGCSYETKPSWQTDTGCSYRTVNDLAIVADPATGVAGYSLYVGGWTVFGGTSIGAPIVAAMYALAGNGSSINNPSMLYQNPNGFAPVTSRSNGTCYPNYLCTGGPGYDGPSGLGMPVGLSAF
jgi:subtilase family serine protease